MSFERECTHRQDGPVTGWSTHACTPLDETSPAGAQAVRSMTIKDRKMIRFMAYPFIARAR